MLYVVATPIGNLEDITLRALKVLQEVDYLLCEDTRQTQKLLARYNLAGKKLISYHQHTNEKKLAEIVALVKNNKVALVTDAGTPGISDPGGKLIKEIVGTGLDLSSIPIVPIPGPCALITALSVSGLPTDKFIFKGFVPHKKGRETFFREVVEAEETVVFYESCHRILKTLASLSDCHPEDPPVGGDEGSRDKSDGIPPPRQARGRNDIRQKKLVVCRELTKKFETIYRGTAEEILAEIKKGFPNGKPLGEFVIVVG